MKKNQLLLIVKLLVIVGAFALVFHKTDIERIGTYLTSINPKQLILAYLFLTLAQIASAFRTKHYFNKQGIEFNNKFTIGMYFTGMFFNTLLPGGIGGDGYKVFLIKKLTGFSKMKSFGIMLSERANGLLALLLLAYGFAFFIDFSEIIPYSRPLLYLAIFATIIGYFLSAKIILKEQPKTALGALPYSFFVQLCSVAIVLLILQGIEGGVSSIHQVIVYVFIFLASSVLAVLPISIGGVGIREVAFLYGATLFGLNAELGIAIAIIYFAINLICSLNGLFFWHKLEKLYSSSTTLEE